MKILIFDLDDTLLNSQKTIHSSNKRSLINRLNCGDIVIVATSRPFRAVKRFLDETMLSRCWVVSLNGSVLHAPNGLVKVFSIIDKPFCKSLLYNINLNLNCNLFFEFTGEFFSSNKVSLNRQLLNYNFATENMHIPLDQIEDINVISKIAVDGKGKNIHKYKKYFSNKSLNVIPCHHDTFFNIVSSGVDKKNTISFILAKLGVSWSDTIAFGDDIPDMEMMKMAGISVAVKNAVKEVKEISDIEIEDCNSDGISKFLDSLI